METTEQQNQPKNQIIKGTLMTLFAGIAWGMSGACGQYLMAHGMSVLSLTDLRLIISGVCLLAMSYVFTRGQLVAFFKEKKNYAKITLFAFIGLFMNQFTYLEAIHLSNAGTATVLQYLCPVIILVYMCLKNRTAPTVSEVMSIVLAILGTFIIATHGQLNQLSVTPLGLFWGIFSGFTYAIYIMLPIKLIQEYGSLTVIGVGMVIAGVILFPMSGLTTLDITYSLDIIAALVGIILIGTIISYTMFLKGTSYIGPVKSSLIAAVEPISAVFFAFLIMNEHFFAIDFVGMAMILAAVVLISVKDLLKERRKKEQGVID